MNKDKLIELAEEAGIGLATHTSCTGGKVIFTNGSQSLDSLQRFAELVRNETLEWAAVLCDDCCKEQIRSLKL